MSILSIKSTLQGLKFCPHLHYEHYDLRDFLRQIMYTAERAQVKCSECGR